MFARLKRFFLDNFSPKKIIAVSKYGAFVILDQGKEVPVTVCLFIRGTKRGSFIYEARYRKDRFPSVVFWVLTGKFQEENKRDAFEWLLSERELAKQLLKQLIKD